MARAGRPLGTRSLTPRGANRPRAGASRRPPGPQAVALRSSWGAPPSRRARGGQCGFGWSLARPLRAKGREGGGVVCLPPLALYLFRPFVRVSTPRARREGPRNGSPGGDTATAGPSPTLGLLCGPRGALGGRRKGRGRKGEGTRPLCSEPPLLPLFPPASSVRWLGCFKRERGHAPAIRPRVSAPGTFSVLGWVHQGRVLWSRGRGEGGGVRAQEGGLSGGVSFARTGVAVAVARERKRGRGARCKVRVLEVCVASRRERPPGLLLRLDAGDDAAARRGGTAARPRF